MSTQSALTLNSLKPTPGHLLVQPADTEKQTDSGIYLPESHDEAPLYGTVVSVGSDLLTESGTTIKAPAKVGDMVVYKKWGGSEFTLGQSNYQFLKFEDILAVASNSKKGNHSQNK